MNRQDEEASDDQDEGLIQHQNGNQYRHGNGPQLVNQNEDDSEDSGAEQEDIGNGQAVREEGLLGEDEIEEIDT